MSCGPDEWVEAQLKHSNYSCHVIQTVSDARAAGVVSLNKHAAKSQHKFIIDDSVNKVK